MDMITQVFTNKNQIKTKADTFNELVALNPNDPNKKKKAAASIGGSRTHRYLEIAGNDYRCTRDKR